MRYVETAVGEGNQTAAWRIFFAADPGLPIAVVAHAGGVLSIHTHLFAIRYPSHTQIRPV